MTEEKTVKTVTIELPQGTQATFAEGLFTVKGPKGEEKRQISPEVKIAIAGNQITVTPRQKGKKGKKFAGTWGAHIRNLVRGVTEGHTYTLKICSSHFPMSVAVEKNKLVVKNFMGEKVARELGIKQGVSVKIEGQEITVESTSKERAGNTASDIEKLTQRAAYDKRIFQDGIYITSKDGKVISA